MAKSRARNCSEPGPIILASRSPYKAELLQRLRLEFKSLDPIYVEEHDLALEPVEKARYLAEQKVRSLLGDYPRSFIIGSDQLLYCDGELLKKPGSREKAIEQLKSMRRAKRVCFYTGIALYTPLLERVFSKTVLCRVYLRKNLTDEELENYVDLDQPYNCAGAFKIESLGIILMSRIVTHDYTSLIGLPLIALYGLMRQGRLPILTFAADDD